jgi:tripartite-type tricarboxylate transporter receptor subunit TctC
MRFFLLLIAALVFSAPAMAEYPDRPIRIILPYSPGGGADVVARPLAVELGKRLGVSVIIENKGGASGNIAMEYVAHSPADGYTLVLPLTAQVSVNQNLYKKLPYDAEKDFAPITVLGRAAYFLAINPAVPAKNLQEFIALAKKNPGKFSYASTGLGSGLHLSMELFKSIAGIDLVHIPYKGGSEAYTDLLAGRVEAMFVGAGSAKQWIDSGRMRALAVSTTQRAAVLPNVPTFAEAGLPGFESDVWYALLAPKATPPAVQKKLHDEVVAALQSPELQKALTDNGIKPIGGTPQELTDYMKSESVKWGEVMKQAKVVPE